MGPLTEFYQSLKNQTYHKTRDESKINEISINYKHKVSIFPTVSFASERDITHRSEDWRGWSTIEQKSDWSYFFKRNRRNGKYLAKETLFTVNSQKWKANVLVYLCFSWNKEISICKFKWNNNSIKSENN